MGDTAQFGGVRASYHAARHDARALRWRRQSNSDNNGTLREAGDRALLGTHAQSEREAFASGVARPRISRRFERGQLSRVRSSPFQQLHEDAIDIGAQSRKGCVVSLWPDSNDDVGSYACREKTRPRQLTQATFYPVTRNCRLSEARNDQSDTSSWSLLKQERGSDDPNLE